jgi:lysozyme
MHHYLSTVQPTDGERLVIDYENIPGEVPPTLMNLIEAVAILQREVPTCPVAIYSGHLIKQDLGEAYDSLLASCSLWIAHYGVEEPAWPTDTWPTWDVWQYTDVEIVDGVSEPCDGDRFNGDERGVRQWFNAYAAVPVPELPVVTVEITAPEGVLVIVVVNGEGI